MYDIENIKNINDSIEFLQNLACDYEKNKDEWQNCSINAYIEAVAAYIKDSSDPDAAIVADWSGVDAAKVAKMFYMGKIYE